MRHKEIPVTVTVGIMAGTAGDGASVAVVRFKRRSFQLTAYRTYPYPRALAKEVLRGPGLTVPQLSRLNMELGLFFARAVRKCLASARVALGRVAVIGSHGQTVYHGPRERPANTLQIGEPALIAEETGVPVVADFRTGDIAAGGEGAPLIPFFDEYFFGRGPARTLQNIGGIANVTRVGRELRPVAFDTGPGNCLIDWAVRRATRGRFAFDRGGRLALRGRIDLRAVAKMSSHPYFKKPPPKSTGRELFNERFLPQALRRRRLEDLVATLTYFTAWSIAQSYRKFLGAPLTEVLVSGGGALNPVLMAHLADLLRPTPVRSIESLGIPAQAKEPIAFAFLALRALEGRINHAPWATGARRACVLGKMLRP